MTQIERNLAPFSRRVRFARAWRGLALGLLVGGLAAVVAVILDFAKFWIVEWPVLLALCGGGAVVGALCGLLWPLTVQQVARSVDRRAGLKDRSVSAMDDSLKNAPFADLIQEDATSHLVGVKPSQVFPLKFGRIQGLAFGSVALAIAGLWLLESAATLSPGGKAAQKELEKAGQTIERVAKELESDTLGDKVQERELASKLRKFAKELDRGRLNKEEAMQKAEKLAEDAKKLADERVAQAEAKGQELQAQALQKAFEKNNGKLDDLKNLQLDPKAAEMLESAMKESGADQMPSKAMDEQTMQQLGMSDQAQQLMQLSQEQRDALREQLEKRMQELKQKLADKNLSAEERKKLEEQLKSAEELQQQLKISEDAQKALDALMNSDEYKELSELMSKMESAANQVKGGQPMTKEQVEELQKQLDEWAEQMKDPEFREQMKKAMQEMIDKLKNGEVDMKAGGT